MRTELLWGGGSVLRVTSGPRVKLAGRKSAKTPATPPHPVFNSTDCSKEVVAVLAFIFIALWFNLRGDLFNVLSCVILILCFQSF